MKETFIIFVISFSFFTLHACNNPPSKIQSVGTFTIAQCQALFQKTAELFEKADAEKVFFDPNIADALLEAGEMFLNNCTDPDLPLVAQTERLAELAQFSQVIPLSKEYCYHYSPTTQLIDVDSNGVDELILHAQPFNCAGSEMVGGSGGLSIIFFRDDVIERWKGQVIWPVPYFVNEEDKDRAANYVWQYHPEPNVQMLDIVDSKGRTFMAISGSYYAASWSMNMVTVLRWEDNQKQLVLETGLNDLCGQPDEFEIGKDYIFLPGAEATDRCEERAAQRYVFEDDEFVIK
jgi:hypothetical protein